MKKLNFEPFWGLSSKHLQIFVSAAMPAGTAPPTNQWLVDIGNGDKLSCEVSTPINWDEKTTIAMIHGLGGSYESSYIPKPVQRHPFGLIQSLGIELILKGSILN